MAVVGIVSPNVKRWAKNNQKTGTTRRLCPLYLLAARHGTPLQSQCYLKMRVAHFTGESGFAPTELVYNNLYT